MSWHLAAHKSELARPGDYVLLPWEPVAGGEIAIANADGRIFAFDNLCPHRGARIFTELRGNREPRCVYHGRLATPGNCRQFKTTMRGDFVLVEDGDGGLIPTDDWPLTKFIVSAPPLRFHSALSFVMDCAWWVAVENALDYEHVAGVHADSLAKLGLVPKALHCYPGGSSLHEFRAEARLGRMRRFFPREQDFDYVHAFVFPYSCLSSTRGWTYSLQHYFPRDDGRTTFIHRLFAADTTRPMPEFFDSVAKLNAQVFAEDAAICARVPADFPGQLGPREERIAHFRGAS